jgi:N-glycosylase/DNA lyase
MGSRVASTLRHVYNPLARWLKIPIALSGFDRLTSRAVRRTSSSDDRVVLSELSALVSLRPLANASFGPRGDLIKLSILGDSVRFWWGQPDQIGTPAFWALICSAAPETGRPRLGSTLAEEVVACLLGGFGIPAEVSGAAFVSLRNAGAIAGTGTWDARQIEAVLVEPLAVPGRPRPVRYRYPRQRSLRIAAALEILATNQPPVSDQNLRRWLQDFPGIGPKTASWITRNVGVGTDVAVIDIHVRRAGLAAGFFRSDWTLPRDYLRFEIAFAAVARLAGVSTTALDQTIWNGMRQMGAYGRSRVRQASGGMSTTQSQAQ